MRLALNESETILAPMKRIPILTAFFLLLAAARAADAPSTNQQQEQQILAVAKEVQTQQLAIAENQVKIDEKLAEIAEHLRLARIYTARGGGK
jgi:hypothetical protein